MDKAIWEFIQEWREGDREIAKRMARAYVNQHRSFLQSMLGHCTLDDLVRLVEAYRDAGREKDRAVVDMWLLSEYDPQHISGTLNLGGVVAAVEAQLRGESR